MARLIRLMVCILLFGLPVLAQSTPDAQQAGSQEEGLQKPAPPITMLPLDTSTADELEAQGDSLRALNMHLDAADSYKAALRKKPTAVLYNKLGITLILLRRPGEAEAAINHAIQMQKTYADAWNNLGSVYYMEANYKRASSEFERAIKVSDQGAHVDQSTEATYHSNLGSSYFNRKELVKAAKEYQIALKLDPYVFERSSRRGITAMMGKPQSERAEFEYMLAKLYAQSNDPVNCLLHLRKALEEGYKGINNVYKDQEFASVRADQRFKDLMAQKPESIPQ